jgi:group I intron endonuclease
MKGIYAIVNKVNGKYYLGSSCDIKTRWTKHKLQLNSGKHDNPHLQRSWKKYGENNFDLKVIECVENDIELIPLEQKYIDEYGVKNLYNINPIAGRPILTTKFFNADGTKSELYPSIGSLINDLTIISDLYKGTQNHYLVKCQCICGNIKEYHADDLIIKNKYRHCGCKPYKSTTWFDINGEKSELYPSIGAKINNLTVIGDLFKKGKNYYIKCQCICGNIKEYHAHSLIIKGMPQNCGCDKTHCNGYKHGATSGGIETPEFRAWKHMIESCCNPNTEHYHQYGGRGIKVCNQWKNNFCQFLEDMGQKPSSNNILGRKDINGSYIPENCFWSTSKQQNNNRRDTVFLEYNGETKPLREWAIIFKIKPQTLWNRIKKGWTVERALTEEAYIGKNQSHVNIKTP